MFWSISLLVFLIAGLLALGPLLGKGSKWKLAILALILLLPLAAYWLYQGVGTPNALDPALVRAPDPAVNVPAHQGKTDLASMTEHLRQRLEVDPRDIEGWILLGRSYKNLQNYPLAIDALETADRLSPDIPLVQVELVEARLFASGNSKFTTEMTSALEQAVTADPTLQKGIWLLGIAAAQAGDDAGALAWLEKLRAQVEPGSPIEQTLLEQIAQVKTRLGQPPASEPAAKPAPVAATQGMEIRVELSDTASQAWPQLAAGTAPPGAVLFIIIRPEGATGGPPLGARRVAQPQFPLHLTLTDADSMVPQRPISSAERLELQVRLSLSGQVMPSAGDWQSAAESVARESAKVTSLTLDQEVK